MDDTSPTPMSDAEDAAPPANTSFEPAKPLQNAHVEFTADDDGSATASALGPVRGLSQQAADKARLFAGQGKDKATDALGQLSQILTEAAEQVDGKLGASYGQYARQAAGNVQGFADQLRDKDVDELLDEARALIRKSPGVAIGAAAAIGFVVARLVSSGLDQRDA